MPPTRGAIGSTAMEIGADASVDRWRLARTVQMVFQDPYASLNPRQTVRRTLADPLRLHGVTDAGEVEDRVADMLDRVGLTRRAGRPLSARILRRPAPAHRHRARADPAARSW